MIFDETQIDRDRELARYAGTTYERVERIPVERFGPPVSGGKDLKAKSYDHLYAGYGRRNRLAVLKATSMFNITRRKYLLDAAVNHVDPAGRACLDFGCGPCGHGIYLLELGAARVDFLDVNGPVYRYGRWRVRDRGLAGRAGFLRPRSALAAGTYDLVLCIDVLEHVARPVTEFKRVLRSLKPGGIMVLQFGSYHNPRQGHFAQTQRRWKNKDTQSYVKSVVDKVEDFVYRKKEDA